MHGGGKLLCIKSPGKKDYNRREIYAWAQFCAPVHSQILLSERELKNDPTREGEKRRNSFDSMEWHFNSLFFFPLFVLQQIEIIILFVVRQNFQI